MDELELIEELKYYVKGSLYNSRTGKKRTDKSLLAVERMLDKYNNKKGDK